MVLRRTKIIATLGPALDSPELLRETLKAGVDLVRLNMSHGTAAQQAERIRQARACSDSLGQALGVMVDLQGPKIRIKRFVGGSIQLRIGQTFVLDTEHPDAEGTPEKVGVGYEKLPHEVHPEDTLLLDDGLIVLKVVSVTGSQVSCVVQLGGKLLDNKGLNRLGGGLTAETLTPKDREDIRFAASVNADYLALSFTRSPEDVEDTRRLFREAGGSGGIVSKIERYEAIQVIDAIIKASDAVMVARGDLGVELGFAELPAVQKHIIARARALNRAVITATQMMESMIHQPIPTRAEVSDVANAVLDGTDAVMLSAETANGAYPREAVAAMAETCLAAERQKVTQVSQHRVECRFEQMDEAIAMAAMYMANHMDTRAILALTESGSTPLWMSRIRSGIPIYALCRHAQVRRKMCLYRGVYPLAFDVTNHTLQDVNESAIKNLQAQAILKPGDKVIMTHGDKLGDSGKANTIKVLVVA